MDQLPIIILLTKWVMYATAVSTYLLKFVIPNPTKIKQLFELDDCPKWYVIGYNCFRLVAGNSFWDKREDTTKVQTEQVKITDDKIITSKQVIEVKPNPEQNK